MIKFFRKIRYKLLTGNKFNKYLLYGIGEILLVVVGILIAVQINSWNTNKVNEKTERFYISGIINDINLDIERLNGVVNLDSQKVIAGNYFLVHFKNPTQKNDSILKLHFVNLLPSSHFQPNDIIFEDIKFSGRLNIISNDTIRNNIQRYYKHNERIVEVLETNAKLAFEVFFYNIYDKGLNLNPILSNLGVSYAQSERMVEVSPFDPQFFYKPKHDPEIKEFIDRLSLVILLGQLNVRRSKIGIESAIKLKTELRQYLNTK